MFYKLYTVVSILEAFSYIFNFISEYAKMNIITAL